MAIDPINIRTLLELNNYVLEMTGYDEETFVANIPVFIRQAERRIWAFIQHPLFKKATTGAMTAGNQYLDLPDDFLAPDSIAIIVSGAHRFLVQKDVSFVREAYPSVASTGVPRHYALFDEGSILIGPTPADAYVVELHHFYLPNSLADGGDAGTTWLSENAPSALVWGTLFYAAQFLKNGAGIDNMGPEYEKQFLIELQALKGLGESRVRKDSYRNNEKRTPES